MKKAILLISLILCVQAVAQINNPQAPNGATNTVTVGGLTTTYSSAAYGDICGALAAALNNTLSSGQKWGGVFNLTGFTGTQVCSVANLNLLNAALQATTGATTLQLGCPLAWYIPLQTSQAGTVGTPPVGALNITPYDVISGCSPASVADNQTTHIIACPPAGITNCTPPQSREWPITSIVASSSGATINDRSYIQITNSGTNNIVGGEPITIDAGGAGIDANNTAGSYTACQKTSTTASSGFVLVSGNNYTFTVTSTSGLTAGTSVVALSGFTNITAQNVTLGAAGFTATTFQAVVSGGVGATSAGTVQTGNTNILNDTKCPANPTPTVVYAAIENGILATSITNTGTATGTCNNIVPTWGAGCIINPELHITCSGAGGSQIANGAFIKHAGKCAATPTITSFTDTLGGTVPVGLAISVFTAQSASGSAAGGNCPANCGILHAEIPLLEVVDNGGTNQNAPMGSQVHDLIIDLRQNADAICYRDLGGNEHTRFYNINCTGMVMRGIDRSTKQTNSGDEIYGFRGVVGKLPNQAVPPASSGTGTVVGTTLTTTAGSGFFYGLNVAGTPACTYAANTPIYLTLAGVTTANSISSCTASATVTLSNGSAIITGVGTTQGLYAGLPIHLSTTGALPTGFTAGTVYFVSVTNLTANTFSVSATNGGSIITAGSAGSGTHTAMAGLTVTLGTAPGNNTYTYYVPGCDVGTEAVYAGGGFGHGLGNYTVDYSACTSVYDYPYINSNAGTAVQHLPNCGIRAETNYFGTTIHDGHTERAEMNICAGLGAPVYGLSMLSDYGQPNGITNVTGQFQNYHPTNIKIFNDYYSNSLSNTATQQYTVVNAPTSFNSYYSLVDDNPVGTGFTAGPADPYNLGIYAVEWTSVQGSSSNTVVANVVSTTPFGNQAGSGNQHASIVTSTVATAIGTTTLCPSQSGGCNVPGTYHIHLTMVGAGTACANVTAGSVAPTITYTDPLTTAHTAIAFPLFDQKTGTLTTAMNFNTALGTEGASGDMNVTTNGSVIQVATTYTACTTGTGTYTITGTVSRLQ